MLDLVGAPILAVLIRLWVLLGVLELTMLPLPIVHALPRRKVIRLARIVSTIMHLGCIEVTVLSAYVCYGGSSMRRFLLHCAAGVEDVMMWSGHGGQSCFLGCRDCGGRLRFWR